MLHELPKKGVTVTQQLRQGSHRCRNDDNNTTMIATFAIVATVAANLDA
jgi:hypothetical protein